MNKNAPHQASRVGRCLFLAAFAVPAMTLAQDPAADAAMVQEPLIITATRLEANLNEVLASADVLTREDIERSAASDLLELLRRLPGVDISRTGGPGSQTSVFLRGSNSNHVLVMIDGTRVASVHSGAFAFETLPVSQIERIEVVRGPAASFYGSDAIGGVIQIFTRKPQGHSLRLMAGSYNERAGEYSGRWDGDGMDSWASVGWRELDGFSAQNQNGFSFDPDDDGFENASLSGGIRTRIGDQQITATVLANDHQIEFDQGASDTRTVQLNLNMSGALTSALSHRLNLGYADEDRETAAFFSQFDSERLDLDWQINTLISGRHSVTAGLALIDEEGLSLNSFDNSVTYQGDRQNRAAFAGWSASYGAHELEASVRLDDNSEFGSETTGRLAWAMSLSNDWRLIASHGTAFRAPSLSEQLSPGFGGLFAGNPDLNPETSASSELALDWSGRQQHVRISAYQNSIDDLISFSGTDFQAINIAEADITGVELAWAYRHDIWDVKSSVTLQDAEDAGSKQSLLRRPDRKASISADYRLESGGSMGAEVFYSGEAEDFGVTLDSYSIVNLRSRLPLGQRTVMELKIENLLDQDYQLAQGFNTPGRSGYIAFSWTF